MRASRYDVCVKVISFLHKSNIPAQGKVQAGNPVAGCGTGDIVKASCNISAKVFKKCRRTIESVNLRS
jgi:hypothetical protein